MQSGVSWGGAQVTVFWIVGGSPKQLKKLRKSGRPLSLTTKMLFFVLVNKWARKQQPIENDKDRTFHIKLGDMSEGVRVYGAEAAEDTDYIDPYKDVAFEDVIEPSKDVSFVWNGIEVIYTHNYTDRGATNTFDAQQLSALFNNDHTNKSNSLLDLCQPNNNDKKKYSQFAFNPKAALEIKTCDLSKIREIFDEIKAQAIYKHCRAEKVPHVYVWESYDEWSVTEHVPKRDVILPKGLKETLTQDLSYFLENKEWYDSVDVPHRRGYIFYGLPGTGKTSTIITLAKLFKLDIYIMNLNNMTSKSFERAVRAAADGILVFEDIDCVISKRTLHSSLGNTNSGTVVGGSHLHDVPANPKADEITFSSFLNVIDGISSKDGQIIMMTTNKELADFDEALLRPGRIDVKVQFGYATDYQMKALAERFLPDNPEEQKSVVKQMHAQSPLTMCQAQEFMIRYSLGKTKNIDYALE